MEFKAENLHKSEVSLDPPRLGLSRWGEFNWMRKDFLGYLTAAASLDSDIVILNPLPFQKIYLISSWELALEISGPLAHLFHKSRQTEVMVSKFLGTGLVLSEGESHRRDRRDISRLIARHFTPSRIKELSTLALKRHLPDSLAVDDAELFWGKISFDLMGMGLFGSDFFAGSTFLFEAMGEFSDAIGGRFKSIPLPKWLPTRQNRHESRVLDLVDHALEEAYEGISGDSFARDLKNEYSQDAVGRRHWIDQLKTLLFAGHETLAKWLSWSTYYLCLHPKYQEDLRRSEGASPDLLAFLFEVLRLRPPVWIYDRSPIQDIILGGFFLPKGAKIYLSPYLYQRDSRQFEAAEVFRPERIKKGQSKAFFPFGEGLRSCVGKQLASEEAKYLFSELLSSYTLSSSISLQEIRPSCGATLGLSKPLSFSLTPLRERGPTV